MVGLVIMFIQESTFYWKHRSIPLREEMNRVDGTQHTVSRAAQSLTDVRIPTTKLVLSNCTGKVIVGICLRHSTDVIVIGHALLRR